MRAIINVRTSDSFWHPLWDQHYLPHFDHAEIIQIGDSYSISFSDMTKRINEALKKLINKFEIVVCADTDEFLIPDPDVYQDLGDYLDSIKGDIIRCVGYDVVEMPGQKAVDLSEKITNTRTMWYRHYLYDKPVITREMIMYYPGQHLCNKGTVQDSELYMLHMRYADIDSFYERRNNANMMALAEEQNSATPIPEKWRVI